MVNVDLKQAAEILCELNLLPSGHLCAFATGSLVRGWGNDGSDVDIYVVTCTRWNSPTTSYESIALDFKDLALESTVVDGVRWDLKYWHESQIDQILGKLTWDAYKAGDSSGVHGDLRQRDLLERLLHARPISGHTWFAECVARLEQSDFLPVLTGHALHVSDMFVEDAVSQLEAGDFGNAILCARTAFEHSIEALLTAHGEPGRRPKWRPNRFRAVTQSIVSFDEYWAVETMRDLHDESPHSWVAGVVRLCQRIAMEVAV